MKTILFLILLPAFCFSQELNLSLFEKLNAISLESAKELLVKGYGFFDTKDNTYLHPNSMDTTDNFLAVKLQDINYIDKDDNNISKSERSLEVYVPRTKDIAKFKSDLLDFGYEYDGTSKDPTQLDFNKYHKRQTEVYIFLTENDNGKMYEIMFIVK